VPEVPIYEKNLANFLPSMVEAEKVSEHPCILRCLSQSEYLCGLRFKSVAALLELRVRIPPRTWMLFSCVCCVLCRWQPLGRTDHSFRGVLTGVCV
jgi:hypothetical protein